ncbi:MAG: hypothetical protein CMJ75_15530 [Planctomycetaceae bacterium]|nr:hypothetical protein [Planctomycetaceae bacterium]
MSTYQTERNGDALFKPESECPDEGMSFFTHIQTHTWWSRSLLALFASALSMGSGIVTAAEYRCELTVLFDQRAGSSTPVRTVVDFAGLVGKEAGLIDPYTLVVTRQTGAAWRSYSVRFSEDLLYGNRGWVAWRVDDPHQASRWFLEFKMRAADGRLSQPRFRPPVGVGDQLAYNGPKWRPIAAPGYHTHPIPADWNNDGLVDIISRSHGANRFGMPMAGIFFWRNIGTNERPRFAPPLRLSAEGVGEQQYLGRLRKFKPRQDFISEDYIDCDLFDWFGTGRLDLITISRTGGIKVYRNTGAVDAVGLPVLKLAQRPEYPSCLAPGRYPRIRVVDWDGSGRPSLVLGTLWKGELDGRRQLLRQIVLMRGIGGKKGKWEFESAPLGRADGEQTFPLDWQKYSNFEGERPWYFDVHDIDQDGIPELLCSRRTDAVPAIEVWRNTGTLNAPVMKFDGVLPWFTHDSGVFFRMVDNQAYRGCLIGGMSIRYFEQVDSDYFQLGAFRERGKLLGLGNVLKLEGYVRPVPFDADGNGTMDLLCGDEPGKLTLVRNIGSNHRSEFAAPDAVQDHHGIPVILSDTNLFPRSRGKTYIGQVKPFLCDWDTDGEYDIIVSGGTFDDIYWLERYDPRTNRIAKRHLLRVKGGTQRPFVIRKGPAVVDWDEDGRPELLAVSRFDEDAVCVFRQSGGDDRTLLEPGEPLRYVDGEAITIHDFLPYGNITLWPCDWTESGSVDLIVASNHFIWLVENAGTNRHPVFKKPVKFKAPDGTPIETSHHENHAAAYDWDSDGRLDLMIGGESATIYLFHRDWVSGITHTVLFK